jgi:serine protease AprX
VTDHSAPTVPTMARRSAAILLTGSLAFAAAATARAQGRARLSEDLADHLRAGSQTIDVIVDAGPATVDELARRYNIPVHKRLRSGGVLRVTAGQLEALQADGLVDHLAGDVKIRSTVEDVTAETIGADQLWAGAGPLRTLTGSRIGIAVIDSGIDARHPALRGKVVAAVDFTGSGSTGDGFGHGTHVAGIIAARAGAASDTSGIQGVAYGASLVNLRVLGDDGSGYASNVIDAIDWAIEHKTQFNIRVINLSLGAPVMQPYRDDPLCAAVERAVRAGIVVVAAAGNVGETADGTPVVGGITSPGNSPFALTVGAIDAHGTADRSDDTLAPYSSKGPTRYDLVIKPDLAAPGSHVVSTEAAGSYLQQLLPERHVAGGAADGYLELSGTSMAAAVASGAAALLLEERPALTPRDVKGLLEVSSEFMRQAGLIGAGFGSMNVLRAAAFGARSFQASNTQTIGWQVSTGAQIVLEGPSSSRSPTSILLRASGRDSTVRSNSWGDSIVWSDAWGDSIVWSDAWGNSIVWGQNWSDSIVWGDSWGDSIVWSDAWGDSIVWSDRTLNE